MASTDDALAVVGLLFAIKKQKEEKIKKKKTRIWCKEWLMKREAHSHVNLSKELKVFLKDWHNFLRMDSDTYSHLLSMVSPIIEKQDTIMRNAIPSHDRLVATLRFLATGRSYEDLKFSSIISPQALSYILPETCEAIYNVLHGGVLTNTKFYEKLENDQLHIPSARPPTNSTRSLPFVFVADDAFPLRTDFIKPFRQADLTTLEKKILNYRVSRARRIVENAIGILASRFRIFHTKINIEPKSIESVVMASCALHNYLIKSSSSYCQPECFDRENCDEGSITPGFDTVNSGMTNLDRRNLGNPSIAAKKIREDFMNYFVNGGSVPWQNNFVH
ncbi:hypothetical protein JTB14_024587 [Gonioctena quinquepunctata]|nr:hypothetical protein JTB14_024587 [Gonioctena quinquepunctata]